MTIYKTRWWYRTHHLDRKAAVVKRRIYRLYSPTHLKGESVPSSGKAVCSVCQRWRTFTKADANRFQSETRSMGWTDLHQILTPTSYTRHQTLSYSLLFYFISSFFSKFIFGRANQIPQTMSFILILILQSPIETYSTGQRFV